MLALRFDRLTTHSLTLTTHRLAPVCVTIEDYGLRIHEYIGLEVGSRHVKGKDWRLSVRGESTSGRIDDGEWTSVGRSICPEGPQGAPHDVRTVGLEEGGETQERYAQRHTRRVEEERRLIELDASLGKRVAVRQG